MCYIMIKHGARNGFSQAGETDVFPAGHRPVDRNCFCAAGRRAADARKEHTMKPIRSILSLLLVLTLLLGWAPAARAEQQTVSIRIPPSLDDEFDVLYDGEPVPITPGTGDEYDLCQISIDENTSSFFLQLKYKYPCWRVDGGVTVGTSEDYGWRADLGSYSSVDNYWICYILIDRNPKYPGGDGVVDTICEITQFYVQMLPYTTLEYDDGVDDGSVSGMPTDAGGKEVTMDGDPDQPGGFKGTIETPAAPTRPGYDFLGWRAEWGDKALYAAGQKVPVSGTAGATIKLTAEWEKQASYYNIQADCSTGGSVSPAGDTRVKEGDSLTVRFAPESGYEIEAVYVDGAKTGTTGGQYTFSNVTSDHKIYIQYQLEETDAEYDDVPQTGDEAPLAAMAILAMVALLGLAVRRRA